MKKVWFGNIVLPDKLLVNGQITVENGRIIAVGPRQSRPDFGSAQVIEYQADYIWPGLIDLHVHGAGGADVMDGTNLSLSIIAATLLRYGVTGFLATTVTAEKDDLKKVMDVASFWKRKTGEAEILGIHLEGPWVCSKHKGAQNPEFIQNPQKGDGVWAYEASKGSLKIVTLAPEKPQAGELIKELVKLGVIVSIGHTDADYRQVEHAVQLGASHITHTFNAMRGFHHREPGAVGAALMINSLFSEVIADGYHVHPKAVELLVRTKGSNQVLLVSDGIQAVAMPEGEYELGGLKIYTREGKAMLSDGTLAGSLLTLNHSVINAMRFADIPIWEAVKMASLNPAERLGIDNQTGSIEVGKRANLIAVNSDGDVQNVWIDGVEQHIRD